MLGEHPVCPPISILYRGVNRALTEFRAPDECESVACATARTTQGLGRSVSLFGVLFYVFVNDMPFVLARFHLFWRERHHVFVWQYGVATHVILKAGR